LKVNNIKIERRNTMIEICNLRNEKPKNVWDVKVDRSSVLGNPYYMQFEEQREEVCQKYEFYFNKKIEDEDEEFLHELNHLLMMYEEYGKLRLFCWCYPKECHAETIRGYLISVIEKGKI
jgi:hypothetical protein